MCKSDALCYRWRSRLGIPAPPGVDAGSYGAPPRAMTQTQRSQLRARDAACFPPERGPVPRPRSVLSYRKHEKLPEWRGLRAGKCQRSEYLVEQPKTIPRFSPEYADGPKSKMKRCCVRIVEKLPNSLPAPVPHRAESTSSLLTTHTY